jgi:transposase
MKIALEKVDARTQNRDALHNRRIEVVRMFKDGVPMMQIVKRSGLSWNAVHAAIKMHQADPESSLKPLARGRKQGTGRGLNAAQESEICHLMYRQRPKMHGLQRALWDRALTMQLINNRFGIKLSERSLGDYLKRWGLTPKNPSKRGQARCTKEIKQWLVEEYAGIIVQAKEQYAEIYWLLQPIMIKSELWNLQKTTSEYSEDTEEANDLPGKIQKVWMYSAVNNQGKIKWMIQNEMFNPVRQLIFLRALIKDARSESKKKVLLIRTQSSLLASGEVMNWLRNNKDTIEVFPNLD